MSKDYDDYDDYDDPGPGPFYEIAYRHFEDHRYEEFGSTEDYPSAVPLGSQVNAESLYHADDLKPERGPGLSFRAHRP